MAEICEAKFHNKAAIKVSTFYFKKTNPVCHEVLVKRDSKNALTHFNT